MPRIELSSSGTSRTVERQFRSTSGRPVYSQAEFRMRFLEEWRRSERSGTHKLLILIHGLSPDTERTRFVIELLNANFRETDVIGWYAAGATLGILLVELGRSDFQRAAESVREKISTRILAPMDGMSSGLAFDIHAVPPCTPAGTERSDIFDAVWTEVHAQQLVPDKAKRAIDLCASAFLLTLCLPLFAVIALCIRVTSRGPALFRQLRVGFRGQRFEMYKFRTMTTGCNDQAHREYVSGFIRGHAKEHLNDRGEAVYKITKDVRVTRFGSFLRRTSLDELPQLWNVLRGDMSLVGPRPPLPYEVEQYDLWHHRRVYDLKPGLTGLWQVSGRSRCTFDEMARMDLQHARNNSLGLYFRVLLATPHAVIHGVGAH